MSQTQKKFLAANSVDETKVRVSNGTFLRARNAANSADVNMIGLDSSNVVQVGAALNSSGAVTGSNLSGTNSGDVSVAPVGSSANANGLSLSGQQITLQPATASFPGVLTAADWTTFNNKQTAGLCLLLAGGTMSGAIAMGGSKITGLASGTTSGDALQWGQIGANNGIAPLDSGGKVPIANLPNSIMEFQGVWNATTNTPTLADGTGNVGDVYRVSVAGTQDLGSGSQTFVVGDWVMYNGTIWQLAHSGADAVVSVNGAAGVVTVNAINQLTGDVTAGPASGSQSQAATLANTAVTPGSYTNASITVDSKGRVTAASSGGASAAPKKELFTLVSGDITNQYIDLANVAVTDSIDFLVKGGGIQIESDDYTVSYTGGAGGKTRITFTNDLATGGNSALISGDVVVVKYTH